MRKSYIVAAACAHFGYVTLVSARHWDQVMRDQLKALEGMLVYTDFDQGFIDQFGKFHNRKDALAIVLENDQPTRTPRVELATKSLLFSEDLY